MSKKTILVAGGDSNIAELLRITFTQNGYKVMVAYDGESSCKKIIEQKPGLIILDTQIPKMDTLISYLKIKDENGNRDVPVLVVIGDSEMKQLFSKIKVSEWIKKPFDTETVLKKAEEIFSRGGEMGKISFLLVLLVGLVVSGCGDKMKEAAIFAVTQAKTDISIAGSNSDVRKAKDLLVNAESLVSEAEVSLKNKDYTNAITLAEKASAETKSVLAKAKEKKATGVKKPPVKKSTGVKAKEKKPTVKKIPKKQ